MVPSSVNCQLIGIMVTLYLCSFLTFVWIVHALPDPNDDSRLPTVTACGRNNVNRIVGGTEAKAHTWKWQVAVYDNDYFICGASLINQRYVLCAAHCVSSYGYVTKPESLKLLLGAHNRTQCETNSTLCDGQWVKVSKVIVHEKYNDTTMQNDISLFRLEKPLDLSRIERTISPVCVADSSLNKNNLLTGVMSVVTGWGTLEPMGDVSPVLMQVSVPIASHEKCVDAYDKESITKINICAGYEKGKKDSCQGDSGGPLLIRRNNCWTQVGIVSWGRGCAEEKAYGVYTRVSSHYIWIKTWLARDKKTAHVGQEVQEVQETIDKKDESI